jgi:hypothetical protein
MKSIIVLTTTLSALVAAAPVYASFPSSNSGMMVDNIPPNSDVPGGGVGSASHVINKRALAKVVPDTFDSSTYYNAAAEKEAEELALALDAAMDNVAEDEGADEEAKLKRRQRVKNRRRHSGKGGGVPSVFVREERK